MSIPDWADMSVKLGSMQRCALWLVQIVGEGNVFTKQQLRNAFPGIAQIDRRIRDLRSYGWVIHANTSDASLALEEQRFVKAGTAVWDSNARRQAERVGITAKERFAALAADAYQCVYCGVSGGQTYPEPPADTAVLSVSRRSETSPQRVDNGQFITVCKRCRAGLGAQPTEIDVAKLIREIRELDSVDRARFDRWSARGRRGPTPLDRAWNVFRRLAPNVRADVHDRL